jgi:glycosyltransferase involved in cell wall biosynthesis
MKIASFLAHCSIVTIPVDRLSWRPARAAFVPVGANLPRIEAGVPAADGVPTVVVYGITGGERTSKEVEDIAFAVDRAMARLAAEGKRIRLRVLGRGATEAEPLLRATAPNVELDIHGVLPAPKVAELLATSTAQLFVRGGISSRRGAAIAGVAYGLPVVGFSSPETAYPLTDAGVVLVDEDNREALADALTRVLQDDTLRRDLATRSRRACELWFSWEAIAERVLSVLDGEPHG